MVELLRLNDINLSFKGIKAINALSFTVGAGAICALIGPNGAGKSSLLNIINGVYRADSGEVIFDGVHFGAIRPGRAARLGIGRTFQHNALFHRLSVRDNVVAGLARHGRATFFESVFHLGRDRAERAEFEERAEQVIDLLDLRAHADSIAGRLPYGLQKRVDLGRAIVARPRLLLLDEPMAGMNHDEKREMAGYIRRLNTETGMTIVLIEHDVAIVLGLASQVVVLDYGRKIADGAPQDIRSNPDVIAAYLGTVH